MPSLKRLVLVFCLVALLSATSVDAKKKKKKKVVKKEKGRTSVSFGGAEQDGFELGETDEEFRMRLTGSKTPQAQKIVTGTDPRKKATGEVEPKKVHARAEHLSACLSVA